MGTILLIGSGDQQYREYVCAAISARHRLVLLDRAAPTWQRRYIVAHQQVDLDDPHRALAAARDCVEEHQVEGLLTYDETRVELTADLAARLGIAHLSPEAAARCRDKLATRRALAQAGVPSARVRHVNSFAEAQQAAAEIGYPVVLKPRGLAGSVGVVRVDAPDQLPCAYADCRRARLPGAAALAGLLVEEYLDGPEVSVDCVVLDGAVEMVTVAHKRLGLAPFFEELGHVVPGTADGALPREDLRDVVVRAHRALDIRQGVTHTEVRLTSAGPRIVEVNARLGGDLIPHLGRLATGVDLAAAAADVAVGRAPQLAVTHSQAAAVRFFYPKADLRVDALAVEPGWAAPPWLDRLCWGASVGDVLRLPPHGFLSRLGFAVVTGRDERECLTRLDDVQRHLRVSSTPLAAAAGTRAVQGVPA